MIRLRCHVRGILMLQMLGMCRSVTGFVPAHYRATMLSMSRPHSSYIFEHGKRLFCGENNEKLEVIDFPNTRAEIIHEQLKLVGVNADGLLKAALQSIENPTGGYDGDFGKSAIRTYRSFIYPKKEIESIDRLRLKATAGRTARQVEFLVKRHQSHQTEWVRHHDGIRDRRQVFPLILILDNVRSAFNVGSLYRTADATGCKAVITCGITPHPNGSGADKLAKSALGAEFVLDTQHFATTHEAIKHLRKNEPDYSIFGMETTDHSEIYTKVGYSEKVALVLGNEVTGVDTTILPLLDQIIEIPTFGAKNSLNVAACAPVVLYEIIRQWRS